MATETGRIGIIGGSGLGAALGSRVSGREHYPDTPFGKPSGPIVAGELEGIPIAFLSRHGPGHTLCPSAVPYRANIWALKQLGTTHIIASGATGSLVEEIAPRDLVICDQVIDKTWRRDQTFFDQGLAVHVDFAYPFCERLRRHLLATARRLDLKNVHPSGTYVCMEGPQFSTRAESLWHRQMGGHLIGMTCMPEAKLAREAEMCYALVALPTDYDCWRPHAGDPDKHSLLREIIDNLNAATENAITLITAAIKNAAELLRQPCEHHRALELAIWSDRQEVPPAVRERLDLLLGKYFS